MSFTDIPSYRRIGKSSAAGAQHTIVGSVPITVAVAAALMDFTRHAGIIGAIITSVTPASTMHRTLHREIAGAVTASVTPASTTDFTRHAGIVGSIPVSVTPAATLDFTRHAGIVGATTVTITPAATLDYQLHRSIVGSVPLTVTPSATMARNKHYAIIGSIPVVVTPASTMYKPAHHAIVGSVPVTVTPASTMARARHRVFGLQPFATQITVGDSPQWDVQQGAPSRTPAAITMAGVPIDLITGGDGTFEGAPVDAWVTNSSHRYTASTTGKKVISLFVKQYEYLYASDTDVLFSSAADGTIGWMGIGTNANGIPSFRTDTSNVSLLDSVACDGGLLLRVKMNVSSGAGHEHWITVYPLQSATIYTTMSIYLGNIRLYENDAGTAVAPMTTITVTPAATMDFTRHAGKVGAVTTSIVPASTAAPLVEWSTVGDTPAWTLIFTPTRTAAAINVIDKHGVSVPLDLIGDDSSSNQEGMYRTIPFVTRDYKILSFITKRSSADNHTRFEFYDLTTATSLGQVTVQYTSGGGTIESLGLGSNTLLEETELPDGSWFVVVRMNVTVDPAHTIVLRVLPGYAFGEISDIYAGALKLWDIGKLGPAFTRHASIVGSTTATVTPAATMQFLHGGQHSIVGSVPISVTPAATMQIQRHHSIVGTVPVTVTPSSVTDFTGHHGIVGAVTVAVTPSSVTDFTRHASLIGATTVTITPAATLSFQRHHSIVGSIPVTLTPASTTDFTRHAGIVGSITVVATPASVMQYTPAGATGHNQSLDATTTMTPALTMTVNRLVTLAATSTLAAGLSRPVNYVVPLAATTAFTVGLIKNIGKQLAAVTTIVANFGKAIALALPATTTMTVGMLDQANFKLTLPATTTLTAALNTVFHAAGTFGAAITRYMRIPSIWNRGGRS